MKLKLLMAASLAALLAGACDNAPDNDADDNGTGAEVQTEGTADDRARQALGEAADSAGDTVRNLGEAGRAAIESIQENAPEIREGLRDAGERVRNAAGALMNDPDRSAPMDAEGDSAADADDIPENREQPPTPN